MGGTNKTKPRISGTDLKNYGIDGHKLVYHVDRVASWIKEDNIYPIYAEAAPAGGCNQRCIFCGLDYTGHKTKFINVNSWRRFVRNASEKGLKSVLLSGEGEPFLHPEISVFSNMAKTSGMDVAIASNGVLMENNVAEKVLPDLSWIRISLDAASPRVYSMVHGVDGKYIHKVLANIENAVRIRERERYGVTIGVQFLLLDENIKDAGKAVRIAKDIGVDYFSIKPYSKHPLSVNEAGTEVDYGKLLDLENKLMKHSTPRFSVIFRKGAMRRKLSDKPYERCLGLPFWVYISSAGDVYPCSTFLGIKRYRMGNINDQLFSEIWESERRKKVMKIFDKMDARKCRELCRLDEINAYLWKLKYPPDHVNFI